MAKLIYFMPMSLDGFIAGETDDMDWSLPDAEISALINDRLRPIGVYLCGRKEYETMKVWEWMDLSPLPDAGLIKWTPGEPPNRSLNPWRSWERWPDFYFWTSAQRKPMKSELTGTFL